MTQRKDRGARQGQPRSNQKRYATDDRGGPITIFVPNLPIPLSYARRFNKALNRNRRRKKPS
jgi:hypothetical protein